MTPAAVAPFHASLFDLRPGQTMALTGAGAAARGAFEAGAGLITTYPGSPITETFELLAQPENPARPVCHLAINEHVAFHKAMGYALCGGRALITMKHVGFNVASDPAHYIGYTGVKGGMVILVGTDPGATCSTGEFDFRFYALHTHLPLLEPSSGQEILDLMRRAFDWSEADRLPYVIAIPAGACYAIEGITAGPVREPLPPHAFQNTPDLTNVGRRAVINHQKLLDRVEICRTQAAERGLVSIVGTTGDTLLITSGLHVARVLEARRTLGLEAQTRVAWSAQTYPFPFAALKNTLTDIKRLVFVEDLGGFLETSLARPLLEVRRVFEVHGKDLFPGAGTIDLNLITERLSHLFPTTESTDGPDTKSTEDKTRNLSTESAESAESTESTEITEITDTESADGDKKEQRTRAFFFRKSTGKERQIEPCVVPEREGTFCPGCPNRGFFQAITEVLGPAAVIGGDIGCSSLPPHFSSWLTCMNSGTSIAAGVALETCGLSTVVSLIGDSTLMHSGLQTIIEAAQTNSEQICFVLDNHWTAMTGHQVNPTTPFDQHGKPRTAIVLEPLLRSFGISSITRVDPYQTTALKVLLKRLLREKGFRVVIVERECYLQGRRRHEVTPWNKQHLIEPGRCHECGTCYEVFCCPAIGKNPDGSLFIDSRLCSQCGVCKQICPNNAILSMDLQTPGQPHE